MQRDSIVVFDECHNIDNEAIEGLSIFIDRKMLHMAGKNVEKLSHTVGDFKANDAHKLQSQYERLV